MRELLIPQLKDVPYLKKIWCECFPEDAESYCDYFFENYFTPERCRVVYNGFEIESSIYMFDSYHKLANGEKHGFLYLYAGSTLNKYRGHGNLKYMLDGCLEYSKQIGYSGVFLVSADDIVHLYDRWGYGRTFGLRIYSLTIAPTTTALVWKVCPFEKFASLRDSYLDSLGNVFYWAENSNKYMYGDIFTKGSVLSCSHQGKEYFAVCTYESDGLTIRETSFPLGNADLLLESIATFYDYSGTITLETYLDEFKSQRVYASDVVYYGHYLLNENFTNSDCLKQAYINLVAD